MILLHPACLTHTLGRIPKGMHAEVIVTVSTDDQIDRTENYLGDKPLSMSVEEVSRVGKTHANCGHHHSRGWGPG